jgi:hypothetical protein
MSEKNRRKDDKVLSAPNAEGNVWPRQSCPVFLPRIGAVEKTCWYCGYADFHLDKPYALDVGVCYYPKKMSK